MPTPKAPEKARIVAILAAACLVVVASYSALLLSSNNGHRGSEMEFHASFGAGRRLVTNEVAYAHPDRRGVVRSDQWIVTSGSLFADDGTGWTGPLDRHQPDLVSARWTDSAVFRAVTRRADFQDVTVRLRLDIGGLAAVPSTSAQVYDGVHVFLRYISPQQLYVVDLYRRDGLITIKRKLPGGPSNGGSYQTLASTSFAPPVHTWVDEQVRIENTASGVKITVITNGETVLSAVDNGRTGPSITGPGRVGLRGDNCDFHVSDFIAAPLPDQG